MHCGCSYSQFGTTLLLNSRGWNLPNKMEILTCRLRPGLGLLTLRSSESLVQPTLSRHGTHPLAISGSSGSDCGGLVTRGCYVGSTCRLEPKLRIALQDPCQPSSLVVRCNDPQNADFPRYYSKKEALPNTYCGVKKSCWAEAEDRKTNLKEEFLHQRMDWWLKD
ncbi:hypothetical protein RJ640_002550 [Escallonia rubra]|uniref:Uncharacterized protein n=1 Tax=Escallonia rubra TaxID=112253 RepID=A0AA88R7D1_9ASTE|nr:hypothetical protein RJ640_002550 [Escallonia rubra]